MRLGSTGGIRGAGGRAAGCVRPRAAVGPPRSGGGGRGRRAGLPAHMPVGLLTSTPVRRAPCWSASCAPTVFVVALWRRGHPPLPPSLAVPVSPPPPSDPRFYPRFTLILQSLAAIPVAAEALYRYPPSLLIDTAGHPFLAFLTAALSPPLPVAAYVHYPVISTDMLAVVASRTPQYNNASAVARSAVASRVKLVYYRRFAAAYAAAGARTAVAMTNSSWTAAHVRAIWARGPVPTPTTTVYPPCELGPLLALPLRRPRRPLMASVGQYRPEKRHGLQLEVLAALRRGFPSHPPADVKLIMVGGASTPADHGRVATLRERAAALGLGDDALDIRVNVGRDEVVGVLGGVGLVLHTMVDEHFGIGVVEAMAAGAVVVAHDSGGVATDILGGGQAGDAADAAAATTATPATDGDRRGVLVAGRGPGEVASWVAAVREVLGWPPPTYAGVQARARGWAGLFGEAPFVEGFLGAIGGHIEEGGAGLGGETAVAATAAQDDNDASPRRGRGGEVYRKLD